MKSPPHILALVTDAFGGQGGIAQYNRDLLGALASAHPEGSAFVRITVMPRHALDRATAPEFIQQLPPKPGRIAYSFAALAVALTRPVDIVYCGHVYMTPLAALIAKLKGAKLIIQAHGIEAWPKPSSWQRVALEAADLVLCVSRYTRARILDWAAIPPERVLVLPNTVRDMFTPGEGASLQGASLRARLGLEDKQVLLTVGRMDSREQYKGHDVVIAALPALLAKGHDVAYVVVGDGDDRSRLETLARDTGVGERVHFLGELGPEQLVEAYRMAGLYVMPSTGEGFGIAFLEAMACGTPALGLPVAGARDALADGELGTMIWESELVTAISHRLSTPSGDRCALAHAARARFGRGLFEANAKLAMERLAEAA